MAVVTSGTGKESTGGFTRVTGLLKVKDVLINPSKKELEVYGVTWREPNYVTEDEQRGKGTIIEFYFKLDDSNFKAVDNAPKNLILSTRMYLYPIVRKAQSGKLQFVNRFGAFSFADDEDSLPGWFDRDGVRPALEGEETLISFIKAWGDVRRGDDCTLDTIDSIARGNVSELKQLEKVWDTHKLKVLVGLKDNGDDKFVQVVYPKEFWRVFTTKMRVDGQDYDYKEALPLILSKDYSDFKQADVLTYEPKVWTQGELKSPQPDAEAPSAPVNSSTALF